MEGLFFYNNWPLWSFYSFFFVEQQIRAEMQVPSVASVRPPIFEADRDAAAPRGVAIDLVTQKPPNRRLVRRVAAPPLRRPPSNLLYKEGGKVEGEKRSEVKTSRTLYLLRREITKLPGITNFPSPSFSA